MSVGRCQFLISSCHSSGPPLRMACQFLAMIEIGFLVRSHEIDNASPQPVGRIEAGRLLQLR